MDVKCRRNHGIDGPGCYLSRCCGVEGVIEGWQLIETRASTVDIEVGVGSENCCGVQVSDKIADVDGGVAWIADAGIMSIVCSGIDTLERVESDYVGDHRRIAESLGYHSCLVTHLDESYVI